MTSLSSTNPRSQRVSGELIRVGDVHVRVSVTGEGPPLLLVHGLGAPLDLWAPLVKELEGYTIIRLDNPGSGASTVPWPPWTMSKYAETLDAVLEELGFDRVDVLGLSFGGMISQEFAFRYPQRVRRLILAGTSAGVGVTFGNPLALTVLATPLRYYSRTYMAAVAPFLYGGDADGGSELVADQSDARHKMRPSIPGYYAQIATASTFSSFWYLPTLRMPAMVLAGDEDPITNTLSCWTIAQRIPDCEYREIKGGGHLFLMEKPVVSAEAIRDFLEREPRTDADQQAGPRRLAHSA